MPTLHRIASSVLCAFAAKLGGPIFVPLQVICADGRTCAFDRLHEVLECQWWFEQLIGVDLCPRHLHCTLITG
jgi:hypothetical protein